MAKSIFGLVHTLLGTTGAIEPSATIEFYEAGTTTPLTVYSDRALSTTAGTSVTADAAGVVPERWIADSTDIKLVYKDDTGSTRYTRDYFNDSLNSTLLANIAALSGTNGYFVQFTGAATVQSFDLFGTANTWTATQTGTRWALDATGYFALSSSNPLINLDANDYILFDRTNNELDFVIGATVEMQLAGTALNLSGDFLPLTTETHDLGSASLEWDNAYLQNAVTVSDQRRKNDIGVIDGAQAVKFITALEPRLFSFKDTIAPARQRSVMVPLTNEDGSPKLDKQGVQLFKTGKMTIPEKVIQHNRPHSGFFAQQVRDAMTSAGIDDCGVYAYDSRTDTHELRLLEMLAWCVAAIKHLAGESHQSAEQEPAPYIDLTERVEREPEPVPEPAPPYVPDFTLIPDGLARFALADETADDFRKRAFQLLFRFGIAEGENFEGGGEPLTPDEKITLLPMLIANFEAGNWLNLKEDLRPE